MAGTTIEAEAGSGAKYSTAYWVWTLMYAGKSDDFTYQCLYVRELKRESINIYIYQSILYVSCRMNTTPYHVKTPYPHNIEKNTSSIIINHLCTWTDLVCHFHVHFHVGPEVVAPGLLFITHQRFTFFLSLVRASVVSGASQYQIKPSPTTN